MKHQPLTWDRIVSQLPPTAEEIHQHPPFGFSTRVVAQWRAVRRDESLNRWARWSFRTALASSVACALLVFLQTGREKSIVLPLPEPLPLTHLLTPP